ncbi:hypothetical protein CYMTET_24369, partial [Cymbomonas tetramitiformis]
GYVRQRKELGQVVNGLAEPKRLKGELLTGAQFADLLERTVEALNKGDIPMAGSVVAMFNRDIVWRCQEEYSSAMRRVVLPMSEDALELEHEDQKSAAQRQYDAERFGMSDTSASELSAAIDKEYQTVVASNALKSAQACEQYHALCEEAVDTLEEMKLPSLRKLERGIERCNASFVHYCVGPSLGTYDQKLSKSLSRGRSHFKQSYNQRLFNGLLAITVLCVVVHRFVIKNSLMELLGWAGFGFLELYPKLYFGSATSFYESNLWLQLAAVWEVLAFNPVLDLEEMGPLLLGMSCLAYLGVRCYRRRRAGKRSRQVMGVDKDLDV